MVDGDVTQIVLASSEIAGCMEAFINCAGVPMHGAAEAFMKHQT